MSNCSFDESSLALLEAVRVQEGLRSYGESNLRGDLDCLVRKFVAPGGGAVKTIRSEDLRKGLIQSSRYSDDVIAEFCARIIERHHISGVSGSGWNVREAAMESVRFFAANNNLTGPLAEVFDVLKRKLCR